MVALPVDIPVSPKNWATLMIVTTMSDGIDDKRVVSQRVLGSAGGTGKSVPTLVDS